MGGIVVVTGGSGFIGSHLVEALRLSGKKVINIDKVPPKYELKRGVIYQHGDLSKDDFAFPDEPPEVLYHLAATPWSMVKDSEGWFHGSKDAFYNNTVGTFNALRSINPKMIVFSSTANLYGEGRKLDENSPIRITSQYGFSKYISEKIIEQSGKNYIVLRFGTVAGLRGRTFPNRLVYCAVNHIPIEIFCDGKAHRDIVDVRDIVNAMVNIRHNAEHFNISSGTEISGLALAKLVSEEATRRGFTLDYKSTTFSPIGYVKESTLNIDKVKTIWKPQYDIYKTIESLFDYYEKPDPLEPPSWENI